MSTSDLSGTRYAIYCRRSQERDERQQQSLDDQLKIAYRLRDSQGLVVVEEITESVSAKEPYQRPGFTRLIELIEKGKVTGVIAWHPDRLSRNEIDAASLTYLIRKGKLLDLQFGNYTFDNSPEGIMMLQMALSQSQYYSSKLAKDVKRGMDSKVEKGWFPHRAPEGYRNVRQMVNYAEVRTIEKDGERYGAIRAFWDLMLTSAYTVPQALRILNEEWGYTTKGGKERGGGPLSKASAYKLLTNPFYTGYFVECGRTYKGLHEPMVTVEEFNRVQAYLKRQSRQQPKKRLFAYTGLIRCGRCGCMVTASLARPSAPNGGYTYYHCTNARRVCSRQGIPEHELEGKIDVLLRRITISKDVEAFALEAVAKWHKDQCGGTQAVYEQQMSALAEAQKKLDNLVNLKLKDLIADELFSQKQTELREEIARLKAGSEQSEEEFERVRSSAINAVHFLANASERFLIGTVFEKREIARALGITYTFGRGEVTIDLHPALSVYLMLQGADPAKTGPVEQSNGGSGSTKKTLSRERVSCGGPQERACEQLYAFFRERPSFPAVACVASSGGVQ